MSDFRVGETIEVTKGYRVTHSFPTGSIGTITYLDGIGYVVEGTFEDGCIGVQWLKPSEMRHAYRELAVECNSIDNLFEEKLKNGIRSSSEEANPN